VTYLWLVPLLIVSVGLVLYFTVLPFAIFLLELVAAGYDTIRTRRRMAGPPYESRLTRLLMRLDKPY